MNFTSRHLLGLLLLCGSCAGCAEAPAESTAEEVRPLPEASSRFESATAGTIAGRVTWEGKVPEVKPFDIQPVALDVGPPHVALTRENPNAPRINLNNGGVGNAVLFLRGVDPVRARPWDHAPVRVEMEDFRFHINQMANHPLYGFVRRGDPVLFVSTEPDKRLHMLHADGAAFFTLPFPASGQPLSRRLAKSGTVELMSMAAYFWMRAHLFVDDHPYYICTDADGSYSLPQVPPGDYELVCWMPNWHEAKRDLDPESMIVLRLFFGKPVEVVRKVTLGPTATVEANFKVPAAAFESKRAN